MHQQDYIIVNNNAIGKIFSFNFFTSYSTITTTATTSDMNMNNFFLCKATLKIPHSQLFFFYIHQQHDTTSMQNGNDFQG